MVADAQLSLEQKPKRKVEAERWTREPLSFEKPDLTLLAIAFVFHAEAAVGMTPVNPQNWTVSWTKLVSMVDRLSYVEHSKEKTHVAKCLCLM